MYHSLANLWKELLLKGFADDGDPWDWTTLGSSKSSNQSLKAQVIAKSNGVWAAESLVFAIEGLSRGVSARSLIRDGKGFKNGDILVEFEGGVSGLLAIERPFLNLAAHICGIATATSEFVTRVRKACPERTPRVTLTRKTLPGYRDVAVLGVRLGGGYPHRVSLSGGILIKENHIAAAGGIAKAISNVKQVAPHGLKIEIEVRNQVELKEALAAGAEGVLLDNFTSEEVIAGVKEISSGYPHVFVEVSGGLNLETISKYAIPGVDVLSVGSLTHSVKSADLSFLIYGD